MHTLSLNYITSKLKIPTYCDSCEDVHQVEYTSNNYVLKLCKIINKSWTLIHSTTSSRSDSIVRCSVKNSGTHIYGTLGLKKKKKVICKIFNHFLLYYYFIIKFKQCKTNVLN